MGNTLTYMDQASFLGLRALGRGPVMQCTWIYVHDIDIEGVRRFHRNLRNGLLGRLIERSSLPFGRHRWVAASGTADIEIAPAPIDRDEVWDWADDRAMDPIDPEHGPGWRLSVQPFSVGGGAVSLITSHSLTDGLGFALTLADAAAGTGDGLGYPPPRSRPRGKALGQDIRAFVRDVPDAATAMAAAVRLARSSLGDLASSVKAASPPASPASEQSILLPTVSVYVDIDEWDKRAEALGGNSNSLVAGFAALAGQALGRLDAEGMANLSVPVSDRVEGDTRANALTAVTVVVDPAKVPSGLGEVRAKFKEALVSRADAAAEVLAPLPLMPLTPKALMRRLERMVLQVDNPIGCSNIRDMDPAFNRPDGTDAEYFAIRIAEPGLTPSIIDRLGGQLFVGSARIRGRVFLSFSAWIVGGTNTKEHLRATARQILAELQLSGIIE